MSIYTRIQQLLHARLHQQDRVYTVQYNYEGVGHPSESSLSRGPTDQVKTHVGPPPTADRFYTAPQWNEKDFVPGRVQTARPYWSDVIQKNHPQRERLLTWLTGVSLAEFAPSTGQTSLQYNYQTMSLTNTSRGWTRRSPSSSSKVVSSVGRRLQTPRLGRGYVYLSE